jgi:oligoribonuclease (3'-5' exoribonuclease)
MDGMDAAEQREPMAAPADPNCDDARVGWRSTEAEAENRTDFLRTLRRYVEAASRSPMCGNPRSARDRPSWCAAMPENWKRFPLSACDHGVSTLKNCLQKRWKPEIATGGWFKGTRTRPADIIESIRGLRYTAGLAISSRLDPLEPVGAINLN